MKLERRNLCGRYRVESGAVASEIIPDSPREKPSRVCWQSLNGFPHDFTTRVLLTVIDDEAGFLYNDTRNPTSMKF